MKLLLLLALTCALVLFGWGVLQFALQGCGSNHEDDYLKNLTSQIKRDDVVLRTHVEGIRSSLIKNIPDQNDYPLPKSLDSNIKIRWVTKDRNDNIYFILEDSFVTFDIGFVSRNGEKPLLGDQCEPRITFQERLCDNWWYFRAE